MDSQLSRSSSDERGSFKRDISYLSKGSDKAIPTIKIIGRTSSSKLLYNKHQLMNEEFLS